MKPIFLIALIALCPSVIAQPSWTKDARKGIVTLYAIQQNGDTLSTPAFFIDSNGTIVAPFKTIQRAKQAWVTDNKGGIYSIDRISGFNSTYNVVKLLTNTAKKKVTPLRISKTPLAQGDIVHLMPEGTEDKVAQVEKANDHSYYTLGVTADPTKQGYPLMNINGEVVAMLQTPVTSAKAPFYALDINFATELGVSAMDVNNPELQSCSILQQLPDGETQAKSFMYLCQGDTQTQLAYINDFIASYPQSPSGYVQKAECLASIGDFNASNATYDEALRNKVADQHEILYSRSSVIYNLIVEGKQLPPDWTLESALTDVSNAYSISPLAIYTLHEARLLYAMRDYEAACDKFSELTQTNMRSPDLFMYVAQCKENMGATSEEILALNDSAVACFSKPYTKEASTYLWLRASTLNSMQRYRDAVADLNDYEHLMSGLLTDNFYYEREQIEIKVRMYTQAINDIQKAILLNPNESLYHTEQAAILYRINSLDEAIKSCRKAIELEPTFPDAHRLLGICLRDKGNIAEAMTELQKASDLGDEIAESLMREMR